MIQKIALDEEAYSGTEYYGGTVILDTGKEVEVTLCNMWSENSDSTQDVTILDEDELTQKEIETITKQVINKWNES